MLSVPVQNITRNNLPYDSRDSLFKGLNQNTKGVISNNHDSSNKLLSNNSSNLYNTNLTAKTEALKGANFASVPSVTHSFVRDIGEDSYHSNTFKVKRSVVDGHGQSNASKNSCFVDKTQINNHDISLNTSQVPGQSHVAFYSSVCKYLYQFGFF
jgi:hypothetical protein